MPLFTGPNQGREHQGWSITEAHRGSSTLLCRHVAPILIIQCPASCLIWYLYFTSSLNFSNLLKRHILIFIHVCYFLSRMIWKVLDPLPPSVLHCPWISGLVTIACRKYVAPLPAFLYAKATSTEHILMSFQLVIFSFKWTYKHLSIYSPVYGNAHYPYVHVSLFPPYQLIYGMIPGKDIFKYHLYVLIVLK